MTELSFSAVFLASLLGSAHCVGMCGGLVGFCAGSSSRKIVPQALYHTGRWCSYAILGAAAGRLGKSINEFASLAGIQEAAAIVSGVLLVLWGVSSLIEFSSTPLAPSSSSRFTKYIAKLFHLQSSNARSWIVRNFALGFLTVLLPCGWLYAFLLVAASSASPFAGALTMTAFWAGTVPALAVFGGAISALSEKSRKMIPRLTAILLVLAGLLSIFGRGVIGEMMHKHSHDHTQHSTQS